MPLNYIHVLSIFFFTKCLLSIQSTIESRLYWVCTQSWNFFISRSFYRRIFNNDSKRGNKTRIFMITFSSFKMHKKIFLFLFSLPAFSHRERENIVESTFRSNLKHHFYAPHWRSFVFMFFTLNLSFNFRSNSHLRSRHWGKIFFSFFSLLSVWENNFFSS